MKGNIAVIVQNERMKYEFTLRRNLTVVRGDSATGKTTLIEMIQDYNLLGEDSGVELFCDHRCVVLEGNTWEAQLQLIQQSVVFIDEGNHFMSSKKFASVIQNTNNYYVLVTREALSTLPYSVDEIYGIRASGKYGGLKQTYHEWFHLYNGNVLQKDICPKLIITEDSNSGFQFFEAVCKEQGRICISASGKSNIAGMILECKEDTLIIADGAAFGSEMEKLLEVLKRNKKASLYLPESFEWLVLMSGCIDDKQIRIMKSQWGEYIESEHYFSWEQFFTEFLIDKTKNTYMKYNKKRLNQAYLNKSIREKILSQVTGVEF